MSSTADNEDVRLIQEALDEAEREISLLMHKRYLNAMSGGVGTDRNHLRAHISVIRAYTKLRQYIINELDPEYSREKVVYSNDSVEIRGLESLEGYFGQIDCYQQPQENAIGGATTTEVEEPRLLPFPALRNALLLLKEANKKLGFASRASVEKSPRNISDRNSDGEIPVPTKYQDD